MKIDLSNHEVNLLLDALDAWESMPAKDFIGGSMLSMMLRPPGREDDLKAQIKSDAEEVERAKEVRRRPATLLRAKFY
jgi:hypothetical protein